MDSIQQKTYFPAGKNTGADNAEYKRRAGIIAEGEQALTLGFRQIPAVVELAGAGEVAVKVTEA